MQTHVYYDCLEVAPCSLRNIQDKPTSIERPPPIPLKVAD